MSDPKVPEDPDAKKLNEDSKNQEVPINERNFDHRRHLRWTAMGVVFAFVSLLIVFEIFVLCRLVSLGDMINLPAVVLAISPIIAGTTIIAFLLLGVFNNAKQPDRRTLQSLESILRTIAANLTSGRA